MIKLKFNIQESGKVNKFLGVYYSWGSDSKTTMEKDVKKLVEGYKKLIGSETRVHKTPGAPGTTLSKSEFEEPKDIDKYRSFVVHLMWYTT